MLPESVAEADCVWLVDTVCEGDADWLTDWLCVGDPLELAVVTCDNVCDSVRELD